MTAPRFQPILWPKAHSGTAEKRTGTAQLPWADVIRLWRGGSRVQAANFDEVQTEQLDFGQHTVKRRPIERTSEQRFSVLQLRDHVWKSEQRSWAEMAGESNGVETGRLIHGPVVVRRGVRPPHLDLVNLALAVDAPGKVADRTG